MNYTVLWSQEAENKLAEVWLAAPDRRAVTRAQAALDAALAADPYRNSVHVSEGLHRLRAPPLQALFEVSEADRIVRVVAVKVSWCLELLFTDSTTNAAPRSFSPASQRAASLAGLS